MAHPSDGITAAVSGYGAVGGAFTSAYSGPAAGDADSGATIHLITSFRRDRGPRQPGRFDRRGTNVPLLKAE